jgi:hypothetical protein
MGFDPRQRRIDSASPPMGVLDDLLTFVGDGALSDAMLAEAGIQKVPLKVNDAQVGWAWVRLRSTPVLGREGEAHPYEVIRTEVF